MHVAQLVDAHKQNLTIMGAYFYNQVLHLTGMQSGLRVGPSAFAGFTAAVRTGHRSKC